MSTCWYWWFCSKLLANELPEIACVETWEQPSTLIVLACFIPHTCVHNGNEQRWSALSVSYHCFVIGTYFNRCVSASNECKQTHTCDWSEYSNGINYVMFSQYNPNSSFSCIRLYTKQLYRIHILPKHQSSIEYTCTMHNIYNVRFSNLYNIWVFIN